MINLVLIAMALAAAAVVVVFPVAAAIEWRNTRPERGTLPLVGDTYDRAARRRTGAGAGKLLAARAAEEVRRGLAWVWHDDGGPAHRMADGRPVGWGDHNRPMAWVDGRPLWAPRWALTA